ncbi:MAG: site-specific DNA-methyltransferase [Chloroflexota bacterium]|nr:site-specific DNA-methyltransferase [Chloroflexota bacterium]MDE2911244.1 site-specific DNA-methyltransferase [Chloroflexota bacterium]
MNNSVIYSHRVKNLEYQVICGDSNAELARIVPRSVDLVVTSPPYFQQRDYGAEGLGNEETVEQYLESIITTFAKVLRVMKPTGNIVYNMGDKIIDGSMLLVPYRFALKVLEDFDLRLVNDITWVKSNPTPHQFSRRLIASTEPFFHFALGRDYYYDRKAFQRAGRKRRSKPTKKLGAKYRELIDSSTLSQSEKDGAHRALDEVIDDVRKGKIHSFRMKIRGIHAPAYGGQEGGRKMRIERYGFTIIRISGEPLKRDVIENPVESLPGNDHPAIFPVEVIRELIRLLCPEDGMVLDPYLGSGSTMIAALLEGQSCIGIDISRDYCIDAQERMRNSLGESPVPAMEKLL